MGSKFWMVVVLCVAATAVSEEASKADPHHYKMAFENAEVQVVYIHYGPHEKSVMHDHPKGVVVYVSDGPPAVYRSKWQGARGFRQARRSTLVPALQTYS
jgi:quercetin dioxygenase-like cupin family protein